MRYIFIICRDYCISAVCFSKGSGHRSGVIIPAMGCYAVRLASVAFERVFCGGLWVIFGVMG